MRIVALVPLCIAHALAVAVVVARVRTCTRVDHHAVQIVDLIFGFFLSRVWFLALRVNIAISVAFQVEGRWVLDALSDFPSENVESLNSDNEYSGRMIDR